MKTNNSVSQKIREIVKTFNIKGCWSQNHQVQTYPGHRLQEVSYLISSKVSTDTEQDRWDYFMLPSADQRYGDASLFFFFLI